MAPFEGTLTNGTACIASSIPTPSLWGTSVLSVQANIVSDYSLELLQGVYPSHDARNVTSISFCNYSIIYTHPGWDDRINSQFWFPLYDTWNGRLQAAGGGGFATGLAEPAMVGAIDDGYVVISTDGGHYNESGPAEWALKSDGNIDWPLLEDFSSRAWLDTIDFGKQVTESFFGRPPSYSYWNGCSTGGRQGLMVAQQYPGAFDGILAAAPAIEFAEFVVAEYHPQLVMNQLGQYPQPCELSALRAAAIASCDPLDGVEDGIISGDCTFDPFPMVGSSLLCPETTENITISSAAAIAAAAVWEGATFADGSSMWYPLHHDALLSVLANTTCTTPSNCTGSPFDLPVEWLTYFVLADPTANLMTLTPTEFDSLYRQSRQKFTSIISANDPDLRPFRDAGGKMITWHGLADQLIPPGGTQRYYEAVQAVDADVRSYYRYFEAPGVEHCGRAAGPFPGKAMEALVEWVEVGKAPDELMGTSLPREDGTVWKRPLCVWPKVARYGGSGDAREAENWSCVGE